MTYQYEDEWSSKWTFNIEHGHYDSGTPYIEIVRVVINEDEVPFYALDSSWIKDQESRIEMEFYG